MDKREFLKTTGLLGVASLIPFGKSLAKVSNESASSSCTLIPTETAGPFPLDLTATLFIFARMSARPKREFV